MQVDRESWHFKVYRWWYLRKYQHEPQLRSNLCPYMRAVLFWGWLRWLLRDGHIGRLRVPVVVYVFLLVEIPRWAGVLSYTAKLAILIVYVIVTILGTAISLGYLIGKYLEGKTIPAPLRLPRTRKAIGEFAALLRAYSEAAHTRVCPELEFKGGWWPNGSR